MTELRNRGLRDPARCLHPLHGRPQRFSRCHWARVSQGAGADLHRAHDPREPELCGLERAQGAGCGPEADLSGCDYRISRACTDSVSRAMAEAPGGGGCVAAQLGARHSVFPVPEANRSARRSRSSLSARWRCRSHLSSIGWQNSNHPQKPKKAARAACAVDPCQFAWT